MADPIVVDLEGLAAAVERPGAAGRRVVAVAGPPGSGKSTLADALVTRLNAPNPGVAALLPMDGYHYDDAVLTARGVRARKGAPDTFDVAGLGHMLARLRRNDEPEVAVPVFDRSLEVSRGSARIIPREVRILVVEGNYLLLDEAPWSGLRPMFDLTVLISTPEPTLRARLAARWEGYGLTAAGIAAKLDGNDLPNGRVVTTRSIVPDFRLDT